MVYIDNFEWDDNNLEHISCHGIRDHEVQETILFDKPIYLRGREHRYYAYGITEDGRYLFIVFAAKGAGTIRVITARSMTRTERAYYKERRR